MRRRRYREAYARRRASTVRQPRVTRHAGMGHDVRPSADRRGQDTTPRRGQQAVAVCTGRVTTETVQATLESAGDFCPHCGSAVVGEMTTHHVDAAHYQQMRCDRCGMRWTNVWQFARVLVYGQGEDPDTFTVSGSW